MKRKTMSGLLGSLILLGFIARRRGGGANHHPYLEFSSGSWD